MDPGIVQKVGVHLALHCLDLRLFFQQFVDVILIDQSIDLFHHGVEIFVEKPYLVLPVFYRGHGNLIFSFSELFHILDQPVKMPE